MEQLAPPGTVRLTSETVRLEEGYVEVRSRGPIPVKGRPDPIEVFELTTGADAASGRGAPGPHALRQPRGEPRLRAPPAPGELPPRVRAPLGEQDGLLPA